VGITRSVERTSAIVTAASGVRAFVARARSERTRRRLTPIDALPPSWPSRALPAAELTRAAGRSTADIDAFRIRQGAFEVLVMTPQVMAWRRARGDSIRKNPDPFSRTAFCQEDLRCDPLEAWGSWPEYLAERRAVVVIEVTPNVAPPPFFRRPDPVDFRQGDVNAMTLTSDGAAVGSIESARMEAVPNGDTYRAQRREVFHSVIYVFRPGDIVPSGATPRLELLVHDARRQNDPVRITIPAGVLEAVRRDVGSYADR
jgi:hypothetical protein